MEQAIQLALNGIGIAFAVCIGLFLLRLPGMLADWIAWKAAQSEYRREREKKDGPYLKIELYECPNRSMVGIWCYKDLGQGSEVVYATSADLPPWLYRTQREKTRFDVS